MKISFKFLLLIEKNSSLLLQKQTNLTLLKSLMKGFLIWIWFLEWGGRREASWTGFASSLNRVFIFYFFCISMFAGCWSHFVFSLSWPLGPQPKPHKKSLSVTKAGGNGARLCRGERLHQSEPCHATLTLAHQCLNSRSFNRKKGSAVELLG